MAAEPARQDEKLIRALGVPTLTASIINATIGAGIFVLPAIVAAGLGAAAPIAYVICAVVMALVVTSFAIAGSRVSLTGGLYAYVEVAFGSYIGFLAGVLLWLTNVLAVAGVASAIAASVSVVFPFAQGGFGRFALLVLIFAGLALINIRGVRGGAGTVAAMTIAKLLPLLLFIAVGVFFIKPAAVGWSVWPGSDDIGKTVLLLIFAFMGIELALVPSGEVKNPSRTVPRSIFFALAITTALYMAIQLVAQGVLGAELSKFVDAPLAEAASRFLGNAGRSIILVGTVISAFGYVSGDILGSPRTLYAFGRNGILPAKMAAVHPRFRTPHIAIVVHAIIACALSVSSTFQYLAILSNIAALLLYLFCCSAAFELIRRNVVSDGKPFSIPGDKVVPLLAVAVVLWILSHATLAEFSIAIGVLTVASALYLAPFLNDRFQAHHPGKRPYRWGYYFSMQAFIVGVGLAIEGLLSGMAVLIASGAIYGILAWFFAQRRHWAWVALTILSLNPLIWVLNFIYLRKRWTEDHNSA